MKKLLRLSALLSLSLWLGLMSSFACTGIRLITKNGSVLYGRTMEWGHFDLNSRVTMIPRNYTFTGQTPEGNNGKVYTTQYGIVGLDMLNKDYIADGMNENGLAAGLFYHPGYATYPEYNADNADNTISAQDLTLYILSQFGTIEEVKKGMQEVNVVGVVEEAIGIVAQAHWMVTDRSGNSIVIEFAAGKAVVFDAPLGVITNAPTYDWHMTNLSNYLNLSMFSVKPKTLDGIKFSPTGAGSGLIGLPGDNTPPSRFVRAVTWTQTARTMENANEGFYEMFRILDNFNLPLGPDAAEGSGGSEGNPQNTDPMRSSTIWTTAWDLTDLTFSYHTQHNRRVRKINVGEIDFEKLGNEILRIPLDEKKEEDVLDITPKLDE